MRVWREGVTDSRSAVPRISHAQGKRNHVIKTPPLVTTSLSYQMTVTNTNHCIAMLSETSRNTFDTETKTKITVHIAYSSR